MSGPAPKKITKEDGKSFTAANIADLTTDILDDCFYSIIHDIVIQVHKEEKILRMKSAAIIAEREAKKATTLARAAESDKSAESGPSTPSTPYVRTETDGAIVDTDGKIYLKGNPFKTTPTIYCPKCKLPRLLYPITGFNSRPPPDPTIQYCSHTPWVSKPGHDVYGNPFASDKVNSRAKSKKKTSQEEKEKDAPASSPSSTTPSTPVNSSFKSASSSAPDKVCFPTIKCPNCPRYLVVTRMAQHLDKCLGISSRQSSRNAMTKMTNTPQESRATTPKPSSQVLKRARADAEGSNGGNGGDGESPPKKKAKATAKKTGTNNKPAASSKLKNGETVTVKKKAVAKAAGKTVKKGPGKPLAKKTTTTAAAPTEPPVQNSNPETGAPVLETGATQANAVEA